MSRKDKQGIMILAGVFVFFSMLFFAYYSISASGSNIDPETLCRIDANDPVFKVLIDKTDPWDDHSRQRLGSMIRRLRNRLARFERLSIFILDETGTYSPAPVFDMCNPGRGDQVSELTHNQRRVQQKFDKEFAAPLENILDSLLEPGSAPRSPILETIHGLRGDNGQERLVVISDMMQNSEAMSFYGQTDIDISQDQMMCSLEAPYQGIEVFYLNRPEGLLGKRQKIRKFWHTCLSRLATTVSWKVL